MKTIVKTLQKPLETEQAVALVKATFSTQLREQLHLHKIEAPLTVWGGTGVNDDLNGVEQPVGFSLKAIADQRVEIVQSLAKWKRLRTATYDLMPEEGILTDMRALRPDEELTPIHSIYVDQWDWEKVMLPEQRHLTYLEETVQKIYASILYTETKVAENYPDLKPILPSKITFVHAEELLQRYPDLSPKEREYKITQQYGAVFIVGIGGELSNGEPHDGRAPDYDDWSTPNAAGFYGLNGDLLLWNPVLQKAFEVSSMGIRVDAAALLRQLKFAQKEERKTLFYHQQLLQGILPQTIGGGIGQSRLCMFLLKKQHIGEVQVSVWPEVLREKCAAQTIRLL